MKKTTKCFDLGKGYIIVKRLSRSFDTKEEAERFADGKLNTDIYRSKGRFKVEWVKTIDNND